MANKDKDDWISAKIAKLIEEGYSRAQAVAIAYSMWKQMQGGKK